jgi:hypothetical protein
MSPTPLSPKPQRWQSRSDEPHPDIQALLSTFDTSSTDDGKSVAGQSDPGREKFGEGGSSGHNRARTAPEIEIRTTSPSPQKDFSGIPLPPSRSSQRSLSPLDLPSRGESFNNKPQDVAGQSGLSRSLGRGGSVSGPRTNPTCEFLLSPQAKLTFSFQPQSIYLFHYRPDRQRTIISSHSSKYRSIYQYPRCRLR